MIYSFPVSGELQSFLDVEGVEYVGSTLWTGLMDVKVDGDYAYSVHSGMDWRL